MARVIGIDYGQKRTGISVTDPLRICVNALATIATENLFRYIGDYIQKESVDLIVVGMPKHRDGSSIEWTKEIEQFVEKAQTLYPAIKFDFQDEGKTSVQAVKTLIQKGTPLKKRTKEAIDEMSAVLILQRYLNHY